MFWWGVLAGSLGTLLAIAIVLWLLAKGMASAISDAIIRVLGK